MSYRATRTTKLCVALAILSIPIVAFLASDPDPVGPDQNVVEALTFNRDIAPIVFERCAVCHRPGEAAPFSLLSYDDVRKHADQIADITESRFMPPWLPEGHGKFVGERALSDHQIESLRRWADAGAVEGNADDLPPLPKWPDGWQAGEPDLVITLPEPYTLPAEGTDIFRNFVIPIPVSSTRYVKAVELRPGNRRIVHHASIFVDTSGSARKLDKIDPGPGFGGMQVGEANYPDGHFLGWTPGKTPDTGVPGISWQLDPGTDLVLQLHMLPTGKPEPIRPTVGLFFDDSPRKSQRTYTLLIKADDKLDIPPGAQNFQVTDAFELPVDVQLVLIYPHAHYLGKTVESIANLPDGSTETLVRIRDWDFNWQDSYRYTSPRWLPKGTTISMRWSYDNSRNNTQNPNRTPVRVKHGNRSTDEMAQLYLQFLLPNEQQLNVLKIATHRHRLAKFPRDWRTMQSLALALANHGDLEAAVEQFHRAIRIKPGNVQIHFRLARMLEDHGQISEAIERYRAALKVDFSFPYALNNLAWLLATSSDAELRQPAEALRLAERATLTRPEPDAGTLDTLAAAQAAVGRFDLAIETAEKALAMADASGAVEMVREVKDHLSRYRHGKALWEIGE